MFGLIAQNVTAAVASSENALVAVTDPDVGIVNNVFQITYPLRLLAEVAVGASLKYGRYSVPAWNGRGRPNIACVQRSANPISGGTWQDYSQAQIILPQNQGITAYLTNNLATGTENEALLWRIGTPDWKANLPPGTWDIVAQAAATVTPAVGSWVENQAITFDVQPLSGVYAVIGCICEGANGIAYRLNFPTTRMYAGRRMRPGGLVMPAFGSIPNVLAGNLYGSEGVWGYFSSLELPTLGILGTAASSTTFTLFLLLRLMTEDLSQLSAYTSQNY